MQSFYIRYLRYLTVYLTNNLLMVLQKHLSLDQSKFRHFPINQAKYLPQVFFSLPGKLEFYISSSAYYSSSSYLCIWKKSGKIYTISLQHDCSVKHVCPQRNQVPRAQQKFMLKKSLFTRSECVTQIYLSVTTSESENFQLLPL